MPARIKADPYALLVHTTISGLGIRVYSRMAATTDTSTWYFRG
ncbi:MAG: hypothetical protein LUB83_02650 [Prevotellaceae bacterium]|nr:hypothetical protein [Prevotellaceae bacterium]